MIVRRPSSQFHLFPVSAFPITRSMVRKAPASDRSRIPEGNMAAKFSHLVVLMMENRFIDHMLGRLYHNDNPIDIAKLC